MQQIVISIYHFTSSKITMLPGSRDAYYSREPAHFRTERAGSQD